MSTVKLTQRGYEKLHAELRELIDVRRPQVMVDLVQAREYGDISENAEYETAKRDQGMTEGRIHELEAILSTVEIIELPKKVTEAVIGAKIKVENLDGGKQREYVLVCEQEAHLEEIYLSVESPLGKSLLGKKAGEIVEFMAPAGPRRFKIMQISVYTGE